MNCKQAEIRIVAGAGSAELERHVAACAECRRLARAHRLALGAGAGVEPPAELDARIRRLARERLGGRRRGWRLLTPQVKLAMAASFATFLAVAALMMAPYEGGRRLALSDEKLLAWDTDPLAAHGVVVETADAANGDGAEAELAQIEQYMEAAAGTGR